VLRAIGRLREAAATAGLATTKEGRCDVVGVRPDSDPLKLVPSELAMLDDDDFGDDTIRRLLDGETLCWEMEGEDYRDRGDILLVVDRSASMSGARMVWARAVAGAVLLSAVQQGRRVVLSMFGVDRQAVRCDGVGGLKAAIKLLGLPASDYDTNVPRGINAALDLIDGLREPDVLLITDGFFPYDEALKAAAARVDGVDARVMGVFIGDASGDEHEGWMPTQWRIDEAADPTGGIAVDIVASVGRRARKGKAT